MLLARRLPGRDVRYCTQNAVHGAVRPSELRAHADADVRAAIDVIGEHNRLDAVIHERSRALLWQRARCAFGDDAGVDAALANFTHELREFQAQECPASGHKLSVKPPLNDPLLVSTSRACSSYREKEGLNSTTGVARDSGGGGGGDGGSDGDDDTHGNLPTLSAMAGAPPPPESAAERVERRTASAAFVLSSTLALALER